MWARAQRLLFTVPAIVIFGGLLICLFDFANARFLMRRDLGDKNSVSLHHLASEVAQYVSELGAHDHSPRSRSALAQLARLRPENRIAIVDSTGRVILAHEPLGNEGAELRATDAATITRALLDSDDGNRGFTSGDHVSSLAPIPGGWNSRPAYLLLQRDVTGDLTQIDQELFQEMWLNMLLVLALSGMLALLLRDKLLLPTSRLAATAERIAAGDRSARVRMSGQDEIARASQAFDRMADTISATERELEAERRKVTAVLEILPVGVIMLDRDTQRLVFANARWRELFGLDTQPGEDILARLAHCRRERLDGSPVRIDDLAAPQVLRTGRAVTVSDIVHVREDGTRIPHVVHAVPVRLGKDRDFDAVVAVTLDRRELVALIDEVRSWERRYEKVAVATGQIVFEWDMVNRTVRRSGNFLKVLGHEAFRDLDTEWAYWLERVHADDRDRVNRYLERVLLTGESFNEEYRFRHGVGHWIVIRDRGFFEFEDGRPARMYGTMDDITEQRALEEQYRQAQKMETVGTLAGGIAHDFNNALTGVIGHIALVEDEMAADDPRSHHLRVARRAAHRCAELTRGLLAFSRQLESHPRATDLERVVHESIELLRRMLPSTVQMEASAASGIPAAFVDPVQAQQVLFNLCINARDAMPEGGRIRVRLDMVELQEPDVRYDDVKPGRHLEMRVEDDGAGIAPDVLPRIFEPFFTTKPVGVGTGLGLAMAYGIVRKHHGWIEVDSELERGTTFRVYLPAADEAEAPTPAERTTGIQLANGELVLIADDEAIVRDLATTALESAGFRVVVATDGEVALRLARANSDRISLVLLDMVMPGRSGADVLHQLKSIAPGVPVIISSGFAPSEAKGLEGATAFLPKPWTPTQLLESVRAALSAPTT